MAVRDRDVLLLLVLAFVLSGAGNSAPAVGRELAPGWYWWFVRWSTDRAPLETWLRYNRDKAYVAKALGYTTDDNAILILHVKQTVLWTLPGYPSPAPHGTSTSIPELERAETTPVNRQDWKNWLSKLTAQAIDDVLAMDAKVQEWLDRVLR